MIQELKIKNFKSILDATLQLSQINLFIGENGSGKTNILEAVGFASAAYISNNLNKNLLTWKGIRVAKPTLMASAFKGKKPNSNIEISLQINQQTLALEAVPKEDNVLNTKWLQNSPHLKSHNSFISNYLIYNINTLALKNIIHKSKEEPVGIYGENLENTIVNLNKINKRDLDKYSYLCNWLNYFITNNIDLEDLIKKGIKPNIGKQNIYFADKFMSTKSNIINFDEVNEGILHLLFYLTILINNDTPEFFAIDNIDSYISPNECAILINEMYYLAKKNNKQLLITARNPNLISLLSQLNKSLSVFNVNRLESGHTRIRQQI